MRVQKRIGEHEQMIGDFTFDPTDTAWEDGDVGSRQQTLESRRLFMQCARENNLKVMNTFFKKQNRQ